VKKYYRIVLCPADHKHRQPGSWRIHDGALAHFINIPNEELW
jgi:hypothetical protein